MREERGWAGDLVVAVTGKVHARKRPDLVVNACAAAERHKSVRLVFAGQVDTAVRMRAEREAPDLVKAGRLQFLPMLGRGALADLYMAADVVIFARLPSISIYEAAGTGVRLLVGRDAFSDWLQSQCSTIEAVDPSELADYLSPAVDRSGRAAIARSAFSWQSIGPRFLDRYALHARSSARRPAR